MRSKAVVISSLVLVLFFAYLLPVPALKEINAMETELVHLVPDIEDADNDQLSVTYSQPLDTKGEWQTKYGDAGTYNVAISVSDGTTTVSEDIVLTVLKKEEAPAITDFSPDSEEITVEEGKDVSFSITAEDLNKDALGFKWSLNGKKVSDSNEFLFENSFESAGEYSVDAEVTDGTSSAEHSWKLIVENVDRKALLDKIPSIEVEENNTVRLDIPDFEAYSLSYTISDPIGDDNEWFPGFDDSGNYDVTVSVQDRDFKASRKIGVTVLDNDRAPVFEPIGAAVLKEDQRVTFFLNASDPDGDFVTFSILNGSAGAEVEGNKFTWIPGYNAVQKETLSDRIAANYHVLKKDFVFVLEATGKRSSSLMDVVFTVEDVNQAPVIEPIEPVVVDENSTVAFTPVAYDPDNDTVSLSYSGWKGSPMFPTSFSDSGNHTITITASDGFLFETRDVVVVVNNVNRAPSMGRLGHYYADENEPLMVQLAATDPDNDGLNFSVSGLTDAVINGSTLQWTPSYELVQNGSLDINATITVTDGSLEDSRTALFTVAHVNRAPEITYFSPAYPSIKVPRNAPVLFEVIVDDKDMDKLAYTWNFGFLQSYDGKAANQHTFVEPGQKKVKVTVSDGKEEAEQIWNVRVT